MANYFKPIESVDYMIAQSQLAKTMRKVCENDSPITIEGVGKDKVVMMPLEYFNKLQAQSSACKR